MTKADDVRETPSELYEPLNAEHKFTLDAFASHGNNKCPIYYTERGQFLWSPTLGPELGPEPISDLNGLTGPWTGRVFANPPFSMIGVCIAKCWREMSRADGPELIWFLIPATRTEQDWWHKLVEPFRDGRPSLVPGARLDTKFLRGRTHFLENGGPIYRKNRDGSLWLDPKTGEPVRSSPKFGCVGLVWTRKG